MRASDRVLARRYSQALYQAAGKIGHVGEVQQELLEAYKILRGQMALFLHPLIPVEEKKKELRALLKSKYSPLTLRFLELLVEKKRFGLLSSVLAQFEEILDDKMGVIKAQVRTAFPLTGAEEKKLKQELKRLTGKEIALEVREDPVIMGGIVVKMGDWVLDRSFTNVLNQMKEQLLLGGI
ncbi:MAG: ATP synthase F1 subunit delta [Elusimicrobia bacterium]|nr:ATP synthase F1 subunit delta [Elusimicrobiota bacterium]